MGGLFFFYLAERGSAFWMPNEAQAISSCILFWPYFQWLRLEFVPVWHNGVQREQTKDGILSGMLETNG